MAKFRMRILEAAEEIAAVEDLQRDVWPGSEVEILPAHMMIAAIHNGGLVIGAYAADEEAAHADSVAFWENFPADQELEDTETAPPGPLVGFVFGFPGLYFTPDGPRAKHCSHMLGVHPDYRNSGVGFALKRAQWQMVRHQGLDRITWTYDPLLSRNAYLNIARLGAVCNTYRRNEYGSMRDTMNAGLASDRFQVDWWVNSQRVFRRLSKRARLRLDLAHFLSAGAEIINPTEVGADRWPRPAGPRPVTDEPLLLIEIPPDFLALKAADPGLALDWRSHTRDLFENLFGFGYLVTDFIFLPGSPARSFYVLSHGDSTL